MKSTRAAGMHIHISITKNNRGENVLSDAEGEDSPLLKKMLAGMIDLMPSSDGVAGTKRELVSPLPAGNVCADAGVVETITTAPSPCVFRAATVIITACGISRGGCRCQPISDDGSDFCRYLHGLDNELPLQEEVPKATGWNRKAYPFRFARAMPWVSLSRMITCAAI